MCFYRHKVLMNHVHRWVNSLDRCFWHAFINISVKWKSKNRDFSHFKTQCIFDLCSSTLEKRSELLKTHKINANMRITYKIVYIFYSYNTTPTRERENERGKLCLDYCFLGCVESYDGILAKFQLWQWYLDVCIIFKLLPQVNKQNNGNKIIKTVGPF